MNYYVIRHSLDPKIVGAHQQVEEAKYTCHVWDDPLFIDRLSFTKIDVEPKVANAILTKKSKLTDLISAPIIGFNKKLLVSSKLKKILMKYRKTGVQFFRSGVFRDNIFYEEYWILNMYEINMDFIDFKKSSFVFRKRKPEGGTYLESVNVNSYDKFKKILSKKNELKFTQFFVDEIRLADKIDQDFFVLNHVNGGVKYVVSEKLKQEIEEEGCTGIEFMPIELTLNEWLHNERGKIYGKA
ncbi:hypothetical protein UMM65_10760 [Aureibaculum sp. 2210JD6-5]|uniref:imm11 family protein n=1 Tax=Aureibaculum sp. 2210JD6-5 TaxID=3103957 RepID=UPI002AAEB33C|nr:DUF1629 domain-containing protein [Aureibaculum sp. 2210JD6-5]MDY7395725.1 hypothetical protein [Aureibaculum sp. 2210JD6-5]